MAAPPPLPPPALPAPVTPGSSSNNNAGGGAWDALAIQGLSLEQQNAELLRYIDGLRQRRDAVVAAVEAAEAERSTLQAEAAALARRIGDLNDSLARKVADRSQFESVLAQAEAAYAKILESAQALVAVLRTEAGGGRAGV